MKNSCSLFIILMIFLGSCNNSPIEEAKSSVQGYIEKNLKPSETYEPVSFSKIDTLTKADTSSTQQIALYKIMHIYAIVNPDQNKSNMTVSFYLDKDFKVTGKIMIFRKYKAK